ncbi:uncharacterized protein A1O9_01616 [Exophiala aquamarina CBS 119918]|uniref:Uncharacterized protein n=1 Tax=Exophiala aquamarina CBS 119918 TaxID=1182545 RepID=A0A072PW86_9EURO|nr:uncharacterized protein A1O9_01616 [Exophiala aquamarina CBS 119918]KEF63638.1 hypothetical protein A1O9_01616 [Exophiala aquamarina CBS 119918]
MDARIDTSSGRFGGQWAFLASPSQPGHARSLPQSSSYLRSSERSNISPLPTALHFQQLNASRSSLPRNPQTPSIGGHSVTTIPSQPVLLRVNSYDAAIQSRPPRRSRDNIMDNGLKNNELPPVHEFSIQGILAAIAEDVEEDFNAVSEILGRSRLVLADQHESHLPPQGEIRATGSPLQAVAEASSSNERLAATDDVLILREDASLVDGSHTGSAAYGLLERLQAVPRTKRIRSDVEASASRSPTRPARHYSASVVLLDPIPPVEPVDPVMPQTMPISSRQLLHNRVQDVEDDGDTPSRATNAVVSETYLLAGANATTISDPPIVSESGRHYPLYSYDYTELFEGPNPTPAPSRLGFRARMQALLSRRDLQNLTSWAYGRGDRVVSAESQLRGILERQPPSTRRRNMSSAHEDAELYQ